MHFALPLFLFITIHSPRYLAVLCASLSLEHINLWLSKLKQTITTINLHHLKGSLFQTWSHCCVKLGAACQELKQFCTASVCRCGFRGFQTENPKGWHGSFLSSMPMWWFTAELCEPAQLLAAQMGSTLHSLWSCGPVSQQYSSPLCTAIELCLTSSILKLISIRLVQDVQRACFCLARRCDTAWGYGPFCPYPCTSHPFMSCCTIFHHPQSTHSLPACRMALPFAFLHAGMKIWSGKRGLYCKMV